MKKALSIENTYLNIFADRFPFFELRVQFINQNTFTMSVISESNLTQNIVSSSLKASIVFSYFINNSFVD